jgi:hypothetical protein
MVGKAHRCQLRRTRPKIQSSPSSNKKTTWSPNKKSKPRKKIADKNQMDLQRTSAQRGENSGDRWRLDLLVAAFASVSLYRGRLGFCRGGALQPAGSPETVNLSRPIALDKPSGLNLSLSNRPRNLQDQPRLIFYLYLIIYLIKKIKVHHRFYYDLFY